MIDIVNIFKEISLGEFRRKGLEIIWVCTKMEVDHVYDLLAEVRDTSVNFIKIGLDQNASSILRDVS